MTPALYLITDYKDILRQRIADNPARGYQSRLAQAAGCQKSFLSQVLSSHIHLTLDHAAGLCRFWQLTDEDSAYFLDLVSLARAGSRALRQHLEQRLEKAREHARRIGHRLNHTTVLPIEHLVLYYSNWYMAAIHVLISVPGFQEASAIATRLRLSPLLVAEALEALERMQVIERQGAGWKVRQSDLFLQEGSPLVKTYHSAWRHRAISNLEQGPGDALHYTTVYAMSRADIQTLREKILALIEEGHELMRPSPEEEMVCFACDFFRV